MNGKSAVNRHMASPNFDAQPVSVEFLVLHYSAAGLEETLRIFKDPQRKVSAHLVIGAEGEVFETVKCWDGIAQRAWHAGESRLELCGRVWEGFNDFSLGIELVNFNGNLLSYTPRQYQALFSVLAHLQGLYPALRDAQRVVGHEQIAGHRGKCDPGWCFEWETFFKTAFPGQAVPERLPRLNEDIRNALEKLAGLFSPQERASDRMWSALSNLVEKALAPRISAQS